PLNLPAIRTWPAPSILPSMARSAAITDSRAAGSTARIGAGAAGAGAGSTAGCGSGEPSSKRAGSLALAAGAGSFQMAMHGSPREEGSRLPPICDDFLAEYDRLLLQPIECDGSHIARHM